jgi:hypothetical protein
MPGDTEPLPLDHGYDERKTMLERRDLEEAARFRGGRLAGRDWDGSWQQPLSWEDAAGRRFEASPALVLKAGHWSPFEAAPPWDFDTVARANPFFAQVWHNSHNRSENHFYGPDCHLDVVEAMRRVKSS